MGLLPLFFVHSAAPLYFHILFSLYFHTVLWPTYTQFFCAGLCTHRFGYSANQIWLAISGRCCLLLCVVAVCCCCVLLLCVCMCTHSCCCMYMCTHTCSFSLTHIHIHTQYTHIAIPSPLSGAILGFSFIFASYLSAIFTCTMFLLTVHPFEVCGVVLLCGVVVLLIVCGCMCVFVYMYVCVCVYVCVCMCMVSVNAYLLQHKHTHTHTQINK